MACSPSSRLNRLISVKANYGFCLCGEARLEACRRPRFSNERVLHRCLHCGLHQLVPYPVSDNTDTANYNSADYLQGIKEPEYYGYFRALYDYALHPLLSPTSRILDFGAGLCHYHQFLQRLGYRDVHSLEINPHLAEPARKRLGLKNVVTKFAELPAEPFDLIYANQVLEHVYNPIELAHGPLAGRRALVTSGPTYEPIDPVRFVGNRSSGRMGLALAAAAAARGADVTLVCANIGLAEPAGVRRVDVGTAAELREALAREFDEADLLVMAAAPADFRPTEPSAEKIVRGEGAIGLELERPLRSAIGSFLYSLCWRV